MIAEFVGFAALFAVAVLMGTYGAIDSLAYGANSVLGPASSARVLAGYTFIFGILPVAFVGAPGYVFLHSRNSASWRYVLLLGFAPALFFIFFSPSLALWAAICGASVAALTHLIGRRLKGLWSIAPIAGFRTDVGV